MRPAVSFILLFFCIGSAAQVFTDSNLPIVIISTDEGAAIRDEPKILANMKIVWRGPGQRTYVSDQNDSLFLNYNGRIGIEIRGSSSQTLPKKQYGFSTLKSDNVNNNNVSLLHLPEENDWILNGLGFDPSLIRDYLCYNLARRIGQYASRTAWCEVIINGSYKGLYVLEEKVKQGSDRVDVVKISTQDVYFPAITGGYITKSDKTDTGDPVAWYMSNYIGLNNVNFIHVLPKPEEVTASQNNYIRNEFIKLARVLVEDNASLITGYPSVIDVRSFLDYMIINEYSANTDAYQYSTFFHKDRNGKLRAGPIWDQNLTFGFDLAIWGFDRSKYDKWQFANGDNEGASFWRDLFDNRVFRCQFKKRWFELTSEGRTLNYQVVASYIDSIADHIGEAAVREEATWHTVGSLDAQTGKIKNWLQQRIPWITAQLDAYSCDYPVVPSLVITKINYHPLTGDPEFIEIKNTGSSTVDLTGICFSNPGLVYQFPPLTRAEPGESKVITGNPSAFAARYGFIPFGQFTRSLSNTGMELVLSDGYGNTIDRVKYSSLAPWPSVSANGRYLELADPLSDNNDPAGWFASSGTLVSVEKTNESRLDVFPNPVIRSATVSSVCIIDYIELTDVRGNQLLTMYPGSAEVVLDMGNFAPGIYFLRIVSEGKSTIMKVVRD
jgi:hypothetical protein